MVWFYWNSIQLSNTNFYPQIMKKLRWQKIITNIEQGSQIKSLDAWLLWNGIMGNVETFVFWIWATQNSKTKTFSELLWILFEPYFPFFQQQSFPVFFVQLFFGVAVSYTTAWTACCRFFLNLKSRKKEKTVRLLVF